MSDTRDYMTTSEIELMLRGYRLTTAEILYHLPDYPKLLQSYVWQELDIAPKFPTLNKFLGFWESELEGPIHSVQVAHAEIVSPTQWQAAQGEWRIH